MAKSDRDQQRSNRAGDNKTGAKTGMLDRDVATKAVLDNMARLKALRLAREAAAPPQPAVAPKKARANPKKSGDKSPALGEWLAGQQSGGRRT